MNDIQRKSVEPYFEPWLLLGYLSIAKLQQDATSRIGTFPELSESKWNNQGHVSDLKLYFFKIFKA